MMTHVVVYIFLVVSIRRRAFIRWPNIVMVAVAVSARSLILIQRVRGYFHTRAVAVR